jgi:hypothetical protein
MKCSAWKNVCSVLIHIVIFVVCLYSCSPASQKIGPYRERYTKEVRHDEVDMLWSVVAPEGDHLYLGGTIERLYRNEPSSLLFYKMTKADGRIVKTKEERQQAVGMANVYGLASNGIQIFATGYQPDISGNPEAFIAKLDAELNYIDFKKITLQPKNSTAGLLRLEHFQLASGGRIYAVGFTNTIGTPGFNQDWYLVAIDASSGKLVREVVTFSPSMGYPCDDEANDIWVDETGVYVIGQANVGCENKVPPYTVVLKFDHELNYLGNFSDANSQGYGIVADAKNLYLAVSDGSFPSADFGIFVLDKEPLTLKMKYNSGLPSYNQPWGLDKKGNTLLIAGFALDQKDACFQGDCSNWHVEIWRIYSEGLERVWAQTSHSGNQRVDQAHDGVFDKNSISEKFFVAGCINGALLHPFYGCVVSGINPDYTDGAFSVFDMQR